MTSDAALEAAGVLGGLEGAGGAPLELEEGAAEAPPAVALEASAAASSSVMTQALHVTQCMRLCFLSRTRGVLHLRKVKNKRQKCHLYVATKLDCVPADGMMYVPPTLHRSMDIHS